MKRLFFLFLLLPLFFACKKDTVNTLVGKWKLTEIYDGDRNTGCLCWTSIPDSMAPTLEFKVMNRYTVTEPITFSINDCSGTYEIADDTTIAITECRNPDAEHRRKYLRTANTLIIDEPVALDVMRYKYLKQD